MEVTAPLTNARELHSMFSLADGVVAPDAQAAIEAAARRTQGLMAAPEVDDRRAALLFAADALSSIALECGWGECDVERIITAAAEACGVSRAEARRTIFLHAAQDPRLLELPPRMAMDFQLRLLAAMAPLVQVALWTGSASTRLECLINIGAAGPTRRVRAVARMTLRDDVEVELDRGAVHGVRVLRWQRPTAALVIRTRAEHRQRALAFARESAAVLSPIFERDMLLERNAKREQNLVHASEKRLARLGYDLHDGPLQDLAALMTDLRLARSQVETHVALAERRIIGGRLQDLEARVVEIDRLLRELAVSLEPKHVLE